MPKGIAWTPEEDDRLRELLAAGTAFKDIGAAIGRNKNQCIGRAHRLGLSAPPKARKEEAKVIEFPKALPPAPAPEPAKPRYEIPEASTTSFGVPRSLMALQSHHCRFPVGTRSRTGRMLFCSAGKQLGSSFCPDHHAICWRPAKRHGTDLQRMARAFG